MQLLDSFISVWKSSFLDVVMLLFSFIFIPMPIWEHPFTTIIVRHNIIKLLTVCSLYRLKFLDEMITQF